MGTATAAVIGLTAGSAFAANNWSVSPGGATAGKASSATINDVTAGQSLTCTSSATKGTLKNGTALAGKGIGTITSISFKGCTVLGQSVSATIKGKMSLNAVSYNKSKKTVSMTITKIHGTISVPSFSCSATVDGSSATAHNGEVTASFSNNKDTLTVLTTGSTLTLYNNSCPVIANGDKVNFTAAYKFTPAQKITQS